MTKETKDRFITATIGLLGIAAGAWFQHIWTIQQEREKNIRDLRLSAYGKFFAGQAKRQQAEDHRAAGDIKEATRLHNEYASLIKDSKFPIAAYGGKDVIKSLALHYKINLKSPPCDGSREIWIRDIDTYKNMRREILQDKYEDVEASDLTVLLFDCTLPE